MNRIILFAVSFFAVNAAWAQQAATAAPSGPLETVSTDSVPIEEYVPKVIIEGKWGTGPGEFGVAWTYASDVNSPENESGEIPPIYPSSLAVDSKGNIYVLDVVNNRIQKFDTDGKHIKSIEVESYIGKEQPIWYGKIKTEEGGYVLDRVLDKTKQGTIVGVERWFPFYWPIAAQGINIVIDSKDNLYYYLKRVKNGKETGEVWEFKGDKLVKKYTSAQKGGLPVKFQLTSVGYNQFALTVAEPPTASVKPRHQISIKKSGENSQIFVEDNGKKIISTIEIPPAAEYTAAQARHGRAKSDVYFEKMLDNGNFRVRTVNGDVHTIVTEEREYTPEGKLVRRVKSPPGYSHGIDVGETGIKVVHWVIQKGN